MNFSVCLIARNESKTLPRLMASLKEFQTRGGEVILVDTGSTDNTAEVARNLGCKVTEVGEKFVQVLDKALVKKINKQFIVKGEQPILKDGDKLFNFSAARNYAASLASNDLVAMPDCDEAYASLNLDEIEKAIEAGVEQFEYNFVFSRDQFGNEAIKFTHCKFYSKSKLKWVGIIHEVLQGNASRIFLPENIIKLEHQQNPETDRSGYLKGLALDCYLNPGNDRNSHYFGRELFWKGRPLSAIQELKRHIAMNGWEAERGQSMLFIGDAYLSIGEDNKAIEAYQESFKIHSNRREPLMKLAEYYYQKGDCQRTACYAAAALQIKGDNFYSNNQELYTVKPHEYLYWALWYLGDHDGAKYHFEQALKYQPGNPKFLQEKQFFYKQ